MANDLRARESTRNLLASACTKQFLSNICFYDRSHNDKLRKGIYMEIRDSDQIEKKRSDVSKPLLSGQLSSRESFNKLFHYGDPYASPKGESSERIPLEGGSAGEQKEISIKLGTILDKAKPEL